MLSAAIPAGRRPGLRLAAGGMLGRESAKIQAIANGEYREKSTQQIRGNGYVVDALEAAL